MKAITLISFAILALASSCEIMPRNTLKDCRQQCEDSNKSRACYEFCDCIHKSGQSLDSCLEAYDKAAEDPVAKP